MASNGPVSPDTLITIKVNFNGSSRKFKLPLRDVGANVLPDKLKANLDLSLDTPVIFERYSDSAAAFVVLDSANVSVYKQLYRAAKAKQKLRIRATVMEEKEKEPVMPKPATVEDEPAPADEKPADEKPAATPHPFNVEIPSVANLCRDLEHLMMNDTVPQAPLVTMATYCGPTAAVSSVSTSTRATLPTAQVFQRDAPVYGGPSDCKFDMSLHPSVLLGEDLIDPSPSTFSVYCNHCNAPIPAAHYHCSTCDDGDFDLCQTCLDNGVSCHGDDHWLIKRTVENGKIINSTTETIAPKSARTEPETAAEVPEEPMYAPTRTCNSCISEYPEDNFVTCVDCDDYDLCLDCHVDMKHGHHPKHAFAPATPGMKLTALATALLAPGRNVGQHAICDGCDKYIYGVRHKCLDCPDWDYCSTCVPNAPFIHPRHRFAPIYEPLSDVGLSVRTSEHKVRHAGISCDGPLCKEAHSYIRGDRYKCTVCHDLDFCASCEASPLNKHNRTHPLVKLKTPVRNVSVTTFGEHDNGTRTATMGDRFPPAVASVCSYSKSTETTPSESTNAATQVQTVAEVEPTENVDTEKVEKLEVTVEKTIEVTEQPAGAELEEDLNAHFVRDIVADGTVMSANTVFDQTWILRNVGTTAWPAGCSVKFVGGDNMLAVDSAHPASVHELVSAAESTVCYTDVAPGQERAFTVLMRSPTRPGKAISYWRLTGPNGQKFGHKLWCDITVAQPASESEESSSNEVLEDAKETSVDASEEESSQVIFPKLQKESPEASIHAEPAAEPATIETAHSDVDDFEDAENISLGDEETEDGFFTDDEYDILDASDGEYLAEQSKAAHK